MPDYEKICDKAKLQEFWKLSKINIYRLMRGYTKMIKILFVCHGTTLLTLQPLINTEFFA